MGFRVGALALFAAFVVVCAACGGGTSGTGGADGASNAAAVSATTTVPEPEEAVEQPDDDSGMGVTGAGDDGGSADGDDGAPDPATGVSATTAPESLSDSPRPATVRVTPATSELAALDSSAQLSAEVFDQNGQTMAAAEVSWSSSDAAVAPVDGSGLVTAVGNGVAIITATAGAVSESVTVSVAQTVSSVIVSPGAETMVVGEALPVSGEAVDANGHAIAEAEFAWASSDMSVVRVDGSGLVVAVAPGGAEITASSAGVTGRTALSVVAPVPTAVTVSPETVAFPALGQARQLSAEVFDQNGQTMAAAEVSWSSSDAAVAPVDGSGLVTAVGNGVAIITATAGAVSESVTVSVAQTVSSITVSPGVAGLIGPGATVQLTAEAFDENGNPVAGAEFSWESNDVAVSTVDAGGLVTTAGVGTATITVMAGAASSAATVAVAGFTLSGSVSDARVEGLALPGVIVQLQNGTRTSVTTDDGGQYRFLNVLGQVEVAVTAVPGYLPQTVQVTVDSDDRTLDFVLEHTGEPPYGYGDWTPSDIITPSDPTALGSVTYTGRGMREIYDRRVAMWVTVNAYLFDVQFGEQTVEFQVNPEFDSEQAARRRVERFAPAIGRLPAVLLSALREVEINRGYRAWGGSAHNRGILIHTALFPEQEKFVEEILLHEGAHVSLDPMIENDPGWRSAQEADGAFISDYARNHPDREDVAESFWAYFALRQRSDRLSAEDRWFMMTTIPNRLAYFDEQQFDISTGPPRENSQEP